MNKVILSSAVLMLVLLICAIPASAAPCEGLASMKLPNAAITLAQSVTAGGFAPAGGGGRGGAQFSDLPAFCRVAVTLKPTVDSDIRIEVWLPTSNWNGKWQAVGNGAFSGSIAYPAMMTALRRGYATSSTDTGHEGGSAGFGLGHPEKVIDFGYRAVHDMTTVSKTIVANFYDGGPKFSYFNGCSAGGRQAMKEAEKFPADFDGIIAGAPGLDWTGRAAQAVRVEQVLQKEDRRLPQAKAQLLHKAVLNACDALDGVKDGVIENPTQCKFDPAVLQCKGADDASCLTAAQIETARLLYSPLINAKTKRETAGLQPGSELGWTDQGWTQSARATGLDQFRFLVFKDPSWDIGKFNPDTDLARADEADNDTINALNPNLKGFIDRGGKLIQYHGWSDPQISPANSTAYYKHASEAVGGAAKLQASYRLFMVPGMGHCGGGEGASSFDMLAALEQWVENKKAPDNIPAAHLTGGKPDRTRILCPYPQVATYKGSGDTNDAANFVCK